LPPATPQEGAAITTVAPRPPPDVVARLRAAGCVFAEQEARLITAAARTPAEVDALVERRAAGEPLEHLLGWAQFRGLRLAVAPGVFVPRRRTEFLAELATELAHGAAGSVVVDLCCGCGAIAACVAAGAPGAEVHAVDLDAAAVECARRNLTGLAGTAVYQGDLYEPLPDRLRGRVSVLVANAPYVPTGALGLMPPEARLHEPRTALDGGPDGLDILRRVAAGAPHWLTPAGHLLVETGQDQAPAAAELLARTGLVPRVAHCEELDATAVVATRPAVIRPGSA
jgi:release factor glutamine methyltransferase